MELCSWAYNSEDEAERPPTVPVVHGAGLVGTPQNSPILQGSAGPLECNTHWFGTTTTPTTIAAAAAVPTDAADAAAKTADIAAPAAATAAKTTEAAVAAPSEAVTTAPTNAAAAAEVARATITHDAIFRSVQYSRPDTPKSGVSVRFGTTRKPTAQPVTQSTARTEIGSVRTQLVWRAPAALRTPAPVTSQRAPGKLTSPGTGAVDRDDLTPTVQPQHQGTGETPPKPRCARNWLATVAGWYVKVAVCVFSLDLAVGVLDCAGVLLLG